mgnify:FL=1
MLTKFDNIQPVVVNNLRGGEGSCTLYKLEDLPIQYKMFAKIIVHPNSSIGYHAHVGDEEIIYVLEGRGKVIVEEETKELLPGMINVCKENHYHSVINDSNEDLVIIGIVTKGA